MVIIPMLLSINKTLSLLTHHDGSSVEVTGRNQTCSPQQMEWIFLIIKN